MKKETAKEIDKFHDIVMKAAEQIKDEELKASLCLAAGFMTGLVYKLDRPNNSSDLET